MYKYKVHYCNMVEGEGGCQARDWVLLQTCWHACKGMVGGHVGMCMCMHWCAEGWHADVDEYKDKTKKRKAKNTYLLCMWMQAQMTAKKKQNIN